MGKKIAIQMKNISKTFGTVKANSKVNFKVYNGEILALLGENGSGKTTLMNMLAGIYYPDEGEIFINGEEANIYSPKDSYKYGIGMIHQHFKLVDVFTATENIILGISDKEKFDKKKITVEINKICEKYGFDIDINKKIYDMSVSEKQTVEILKVLYRGAGILVLDEPTAVLTPQETDKLFAVLRNMRSDGKAIIIITHKLHEVLDISDRVAVLRKGEYIGSVETSQTTASELTNMMVGEKTVLDIERPEPKNPQERLVVKNLTCLNQYGMKAIDDISFTAYSGEILGIAGIAGSGQKELLESIAGLQKTEPGGSVKFIQSEDDEKELIGCTPKKIKGYGISLSFVPEDRLGMGLVGTMGMTDNVMLKTYGRGFSPFIEKKQPKDLATQIMKELDVSTPGINTPVRRLSGGNVQKVLVGREISSNPKVLMTAYAVRGLDVNTSYTIYRLLNRQKEAGVAVIYVGEDLDVLIELCDKIMVICGGRVSGIVDARNTTKEELGLMMTHVREDEKEGEENE